MATEPTKTFYELRLKNLLRSEFVVAVWRNFLIAGTGPRACPIKGQPQGIVPTFAIVKSRVGLSTDPPKK